MRIRPIPFRSFHEIFAGETNGMKKILLVAIYWFGVFISLVFSTHNAYALSYQIIDLGTLGSSQSYGVGVNDHGQVVGYLNPTSSGQPAGAFLWDNGTMTSLVIGAHAEAINNSGQVAVGSYVWQDGSTQSLGTLGDTSHGEISTEAFGINNAGVVVGASYVDASSYHAFAWNNGVMQDLGTLGGSNSIAFDINDKGQVIGRFDTASGTFRATLWDDGIAQDLGTLGGQNSIGTAVNNQGQAAGHAQLSSGDYHAFIWQNGTMSDIGTLGGAVSSASAINDRGQVVGTSQFSTGDYGAFMWSDKTGIVDLCFLTDCTAKGWQSLYAANDISNSGHITGFGFIGDELHAFLVTVPLPPTIFLFGIGLVGAVWVSRRGREA